MSITRFKRQRRKKRQGETQGVLFRLCTGDKTLRDAKTLLS